jgi:hypothetical protein
MRIALDSSVIASAASRMHGLAGEAYRLTIILAIAAGVSGGAGCSLFDHEETPQQQFTDAFERGNSPQASYIWNNMSAEDRARFSRGEGVKPVIDQSAIAAQIEHHQEEEQTGGDDDAPVTVEIPVDGASAK